ncbi:hypothetical protein I6G56_14990 [Burkholderia humptydooensis]|uniref:Uncharacterized protein n=2 Tax=Burkholderia humptydooensis TaxID=430531 RepID=A0A7U4P2S8_9BURK|nr:MULTISPECIES: hypothetical protein [Burkholderia]AJY40769.1 hypothetical protein BW21_1229 [Burkholderia sp. 2002721687]ALX41945.1 hypothetical protein AQ610_05530 [Burkholderia humptydooensis]QPS42877.1 hypothetical protein I6G56_14990 [Burkholderia humptydooensis]
MEDKNKIRELAAKLMADGTSVEAPRLDGQPAVKRPRTRPNLSIVVSGSAGQVAGGDIHNTYHIEKVVPPPVVVQTGVGVVDAAQKRQLLDLRDDIVKASEVKKKPKTPQSVMYGLNKHMNVNTYHEILAESFEKALKYMQKQRAMLVGMASAPKKLADWRNRRIAAIHARCKERELETWRRTYMQRTFGKGSMIDLGDDELERLYRAVMGKK